MRSPSKLFSAYLAALLALSTSASLQAAPYISEFLASNQTGLADEDGLRADWIEITNPDGAAANMEGWSLTDDPMVPTRWIFPAGVSIPAGGQLLIFASGKDRRIAGQNLHTNFSLGAGGEYLGLFAPSAATAASEFAPTAQTADVSYGYLDSGGGNLILVFFSIPSPGATNLPANAPAETVNFSLTSRTFLNTAPLSLTLSVTSPTATIRYTTDRSVPTAASPLYSTPIAISTMTRVRARAFETAGRPPGVIRSEMYMPIDAAAQAFTSTLPIVITHTWGATPASDVTNQAQIMVFEPKAPDNLARLTNLPDISSPGTVERRGSSTAGDPKYSLTVEFWDESNLDREFSVLGMPSDSDWIMHAPYNFDRSLMHNDLIYRLSNEAGRYAVRTKFVEHFHNTTVGANSIEGALTGSVDYFGVYSLMEKIDRGADRVDVEKLTTSDNTAPNVQGGYMFKVDRLDTGDTGLRPLAGQSFGNVGTMGAGANILAWVTPKEHSTDPSLVVTTQQYNYLSQYISDFWVALSGPNFMDPVNGYAKWIDPAAAIDHQILNTIAKNADAMRLSAFWHKPRFGRLTAGPIWDFDRAEGSTDGRDLNPVTWRGDVGDLGTDFFHYPWYNEMFKDPNFWQAWLDRFDSLRQGVLSTAHVHALIDQFASEVNPGDAANTPAKRNGARWLGFRAASGTTPGTNGTYPGEVAWLKNWWQSRLNFMDGQFVRPAVPSSPSGPVASGTQISLTATNPTAPGVKIYYTTNGADPRQAATAPNPAPPTVTLATLVAENNAVKAIVPTSALNTTYGVTWRGLDINNNGNNQDDFNDSAWFVPPASSAGRPYSGVGYDDSLTVNYLPFISLRWYSASQTTTTDPTPVAATADPTATMRNVNPTCYVRYPFSVSAATMANLLPGNRLMLSVRYDDGFVCWLNGSEIKRSSNVPAGTALTWNTGLATTHDDNAAILYEESDVSSSMNLLHQGENVLCFQIMNAGGTPQTSSDLVLQCKMLLLGTTSPYVPSLVPAATEFTAPLTVTQPVEIFARAVSSAWPSDPPTTGAGGTGTVPNGTSWSAPTRLYYFPGAVSASQASIQITEVNYHPPSPTPAEITAGYTNSNDFEFVRLTNTGAVPVDLTGIFFSNGLEFTAAPGLQNWLPAGQSVVVVENQAAFLSRYGADFTILGEFKGELDDGGEHIVLNDKTGAVISDFIYGDSDPWPSLADGERSLVYIGGDQNNALSWRASLDPGGTAVTTFPVWQRRHFTTAEIPSQPAGANTDADSLNNLGEYAFATNPHSAQSGNAEIARVLHGNPSQFEVRRRKGASDVTYVFETATDLADWSAPGAPPVLIIDNSDGTESVRYNIPAAPGTRQFLRIQAILP